MERNLPRSMPVLDKPGEEVIFVLGLIKCNIMSKKTATVRARMEPELKKETERILNQLD